MNWTENWPTGLMWVSVLLFVGALFAVVRFLRNASERRDGLDWSADEDADEIHPERRPSTKGFIAVGLLVFVVGTALSYVALAHRPDRDRVLPPDGVLWTPEALLRDFFRSSEQVTYQEMSLTPEERAQLAALTRADWEKPTQLLYVARTGKAVDGYAFLSEIRAGGDPAAFGVQLGADGRVKRVEVTRLFDPDQHEVLDPRFLDQYEGRTLSEAEGLHRGVESPFECTSACSGATQAVRRALFLVSKTRSEGSPGAALPMPTERK